MVYVCFNLREVVAFDFIGSLGRSSFQEISPKEAKEKAKEVLKSGYCSCCNQNHRVVLEIVNRRFGVSIGIPLQPTLHRLRPGDRVMLIIVANIRQPHSGIRYTKEELTKARIFFRLYTVG